MIAIDDEMNERRIERLELENQNLREQIEGLRLLADQEYWRLMKYAADEFDEKTAKENRLIDKLERSFSPEDWERWQKFGRIKGKHPSKQQRPKQ